MKSKDWKEFLEVVQAARSSHFNYTEDFSAELEYALSHKAAEAEQQEAQQEAEDDALETKLNSIANEKA